MSVLLFEGYGDHRCLHGSEHLFPYTTLFRSIFVGIDIIGDYLTEINITSVGSIRRLNQLYDRKFEADIWDSIEAKL